jgi:hypothetical protein
MKARGKKAPKIIIDAVDCLNDALGVTGWRWSGAVDPENKCPPSDDLDNKGSRPYGPVSPGPGIPTAGEPSVAEDESPERQRSEEHLYNELVISADSDKEKADSLIAREQRDFPKENRRKWIERARDRLLRNRR